jgi:hypothetical protein
MGCDGEAKRRVKDVKGAWGNDDEHTFFLSKLISSMPFVLSSANNFHSSSAAAAT